MEIEIKERVCRICLSDEDVNNFRYPCKCIGSVGIIHEKCLVNWFRFNPDKPRQCELCKEEYKISFEENCCIKFTKIFLSFMIQIFIQSLYIGFLYGIIMLCVYKSNDKSLLIFDKYDFYINCLLDTIILSLGGLIIGNIFFMNFAYIEQTKVNFKIIFCRDPNIFKKTFIFYKIFGIIFYLTFEYMIHLFKYNSNISRIENYN